MEYKFVLVGLLFGIFLIGNVSAYEINAFNDSTTSQLLDEGVGSYLFYVDIPKDANFLTAYLTLRTKGNLSTPDSASSINTVTDSYSVYYLTSNETHFYMRTSLAGTIRYELFLIDGTYIDDWDADSSANSERGIYMNNTHIWTVHSTTSEWVSRWTHSRVQETNFTLNAENDNPAGIVVIDNQIWVADSDDDAIYIYEMNGTYVRNMTQDVGDGYYCEDGANDMASPDNQTILMGDNIEESICHFSYNGTDLELISYYDDDWDTGEGHTEVNGIAYYDNKLMISDGAGAGTLENFIYDFNHTQGITIDTGDEGNNDYTDTELTYSESPYTLDLNLTAIQNFQSSCTEDTEGYCVLPINISFSTLNLTVFNISMTYDYQYVVECGGISNTTALNVSFLDEDDDTAVYSDMEAVFLVDSPYGELNFTFDLENKTSYGLCLYPTASNFSTNATIKYTNNPTFGTNYSTRYYFLVNYQLDSTQDDLVLYLLKDDDSVAVTFNVLDSYETAQAGVIIKANRWFIGDGSYKLVGTGLSDFDGISVINLKLNEWYIFILEQNGVVIRTFDQKFLVETELDLVTITGTLVEYFTYYKSFASSCTPNNDTSILTCIYTDTSGHMVSTELTVEERRLVGGYVTVCQDSQTSTSGTITCNYTGYNNTELRYQLTGHFGSEPTSFIAQAGSIILYIPQTFGIIGVIILLLMLITGIMFGFWNPVIPIVMGIFVLVIGFITNMIVVTPYAIMSLVLAGGILIYKMRN